MDTIDVLDTLDRVDMVEQLSSGEEIDSGDEVQHKQLLKSLGVTEKKQEKGNNEQRTEAIEDVSIYSLVGSKGSKVKANDLLQGLKESAKVNILKKNLSRIENSTKQLEAPLPRVTAEKSEREAAYEVTSQKVSRWEDIVQRNRRAESLTFPLKQENLRIHTVDDYVKRFKPKTPLEQQIYALLKGNKYAEQTEDGLTVAEAEALKSVSLEEARIRREELQKHRALLSYHEAKNRRLGKIKSRRHLRIIRKQKEKKSATDFEELQRKGPEAAAEKMKLAEKLRAEERAVLRHRQGSKWAKNRKLMAKYDEVTKVHLQEQRKLHGDLTKKSLLREDSSDEESDEDINNNSVDTNALTPPTASTENLYLPKNNPWLKRGGADKGNQGDQEAAVENEMQEKEEESLGKGMNTRSQRTILGLEPVEQKKESESEDESAEEEELKNELEEIRKRKKFRDKLERNNSDSDENKEGNEVAAKNIESFKSAFASLRKEEKKRSKGEVKRTEIGTNEDESDDEKGLEVSTSRRKTLEDLEQVLKTEEDISTLSEFHKDSREKIEKNEVRELRNIDPRKVFTLPTKNVTSLMPKTVEDEDENVSDTEEDVNTMTIQEAFADDDVFGDFASEKKKNIADSVPKPENLTLPGWGEWGGLDVKPSRRKRKKFFIKPRPPPPRRDQHLGNVIINEDRNVHIAKHQVNQVPFPYTSAEQFERSFRQPIGQTWNTPATFKKLTEPKVRTLAGAIIDPMDEEDAFDDAKPKQKKRVHFQNGDIEFGDNTGSKKFQNKRKRGNKKHKK